MSNPLDDLVAGFQGLVGQVPELLQPVIIAVAGTVPFIEGEGGALIGVIGGLHPIVAALAAVMGNFLAVVLVVLLSSRIRTAAVSGRARRKDAALRAAGAPVSDGTTATLVAEPEAAPTQRQSKGRQKLARWLDRFGVPGASILAPLALPTHFTAAALVATGVNKGRVIFWQAVAIVLWAALVTAAALGFLTTLSL